MNKRRLCLAAAACMAAAVLAVGAALRAGAPLTGRFLLGDGDTPILIDASGAPVVLTSRAGADLFAGLSDGDRILVFLSPAAETYPARAGAYFCLRLEGGTRADLPRETLRTLAELGWLTLPLSPRGDAPAPAA